MELQTNINAKYICIVTYMGEEISYFIYNKEPTREDIENIRFDMEYDYENMFCIGEIAHECDYIVSEIQ